jgi:peptidoglycan/LPS O-acetylase OafA/YrhL
MPNSTRFEWLDCVRGYAIAGVVAAHTTSFGFGGRGVQLFFVASAISLMYAHLAHRDEGTLAFFARRIFRIIPMLWLAVILFFVLDLLTTGKTPDLWQVASTVTLLPNATSFAFQNIAVPGTWSIVSEACFYLLFPLIVVSVATLRQTAVLFLASMVAAALCWPFLVDYAFWTGADTLPHAHNFAFLSPPTQLPSFAAGLVAFMLIRDSASFAKTAAYFGLAALPLLALGGTYAPIYPLAIGAFGLIAVGLAHGHLSFLVNRPMRLLGVISYSVYYWHLLVIALLQWIDPDIGPILKPTLVLALALPAATLTYLIVERPMIRSGARLAGKIKRLRTEATSERIVA